MAVEHFNQRAVRALERAQLASGVRSAQAFADRLAERVSGSPDGSTFRRWVRGESVIPAWALIAAADESGVSPDTLLNWSRVTPSEPDLLGLPKRVEAQEAELRALRHEVAELRAESDRAAQHRVAAERSSAGAPNQTTAATRPTHRRLRP